MRVKRYVVDSMPDALQKIRADLGKDAVIINTKEIRTGGFLGMFVKKKIEVIAATDTASPGGSTPAASGKSEHILKPAAVPPSKPPLAAAAAYGVQREEKAPLAFPEVPDVLPPAAAKPEPAIAAQAPVRASGGTATAVKSKEDLLLEELKLVKEMMHRLSVQQMGAEPANPAIEALERKLLEQEVDPLLVKEFVSQILDEAEMNDTEITPEFVGASARRQLRAILDSAGAPQSKPIAGDTRIAHFVGPTGVGKTTTIAKLAAEQVLKHQRKVGFITSDTYRIAAVEQLRTYATILNVPLEVVFSPLELTKAFEQLKDCDLIFMDTAGRNFRNEMYVSELNALLKTGGKSETFLVLSLTTKYKDMKAITNNFSKFKVHKVLFTKMDETDTYGSIINLVREFGLQTSYIANGQSVPDDIAILQEQHIIDLILEEDNHE